MKRNKNVVLGLSGGVDSSVAATLLIKRGFSVIGVFMRFWAEEENRCCDSMAEKRARAVCKKLKIPFYSLDLRDEFKEKIVKSFLARTEEGLTPNPCIVCNREIKFKTLMDKLSVFNADYVATGHYVKLKEGRVFMGKDKEKDQSYFLWRIDKKWLNKILFPLGDYKKEKVWSIAKDNNLPTASAPESQEICFTNDVSSFLKRNIPESKGSIVDTEGNVVGEHNGLFYYTIGQRKGMGLSGGPYYVLQKNKEENTLLVTKEENDLARKVLSFYRVNFLSKPSFPSKVKAKIRYRGKLEDAILEEKKLTFLSPQRAITPGQSVVFYKKEELLGGGIIKK